MILAAVIVSAALLCQAVDPEQFLQSFSFSRVRTVLFCVLAFAALMIISVSGAAVGAAAGGSNGNQLLNAVAGALVAHSATRRLSAREGANVRRRGSTLVFGVIDWMRTALHASIEDVVDGWVESLADDDLVAAVYRIRRRAPGNRGRGQLSDELIARLVSELHAGGPGGEVARQALRDHVTDGYSRLRLRKNEKP